MLYLQDNGHVRYFVRLSYLLTQRLDVATALSATHNPIL